MAEAKTDVFRVSSSPKASRDSEILSAKNLCDLAGEIVRVFGFDYGHAFGFYRKLTGDVFGSPIKYQLFADMGESEARIVKRAGIVEALPTVGAKIRSFSTMVTTVAPTALPIPLAVPLMRRAFW